MDSWFLLKVQKQFSKERIVLSKNDAVTTGDPMQNHKLRSVTSTTLENYLKKCMMDLHVKYKTIKSLYKYKNSKNGQNKH